MKPPKQRTNPEPPQAGAAGAAEGERIAKVLARAGLCSRRDAERWIAEGRVAVNGSVLASPAINVGDRDKITVDGKPLPQRERTRLWLYHKPKGLVTTARDPEGRPTVFEALPEHLPRVVAVGRLDINTEGLLLLTNDGGLARVLELPATGWLRRYRARAWGEVSQPELDKLKDGMAVDGVLYGGIEALLERVQGTNVWITLGLREGKNREVKNVLANLGLDVNRLIRISYGPFQLGDLAEGEVVEIKGRILRDQLGEKLAREAGVDFDAPTREEIAAQGKGRVRRAPAKEAPGDAGTAPRPARAAPRSADGPTRAGAAPKAAPKSADGPQRVKRTSRAGAENKPAAKPERPQRAGRPTGTRERSPKSGGPGGEPPRRGPKGGARSGSADRRR